MATERPTQKWVILRGMGEAQHRVGPRLPFQVARTVVWIAWSVERHRTQYQIMETV